MLLAKSMTVARQLIACLSTDLGIPSDMLVASMCDRASVNNVAVQPLKIVFPQILAFQTLLTMLVKT